MRKFTIHHTADAELEKALAERIDNLTKPKGSLGRLEELALQVGLIQRSLFPMLHHPCNILFAADHGIVEEGDKIVFTGGIPLGIPGRTNLIRVCIVGE